MGKKLFVVEQAPRVQDDALFDCIESKLAALKPGALRSRRTQAVTEALSQLAKSRRLAMHVQGGDVLRGWLFDAVWTVRKPALKEIRLVAECEWTPKQSDIDLDFEKLLTARCKRKLFIFQSDSKCADAELNRLAHLIASFKRRDNGERYLFMAYCADKHELLRAVFSIAKEPPGQGLRIRQRSHFYRRGVYFLH